MKECPPPGPGSKKKKTNVTNQLIENGDNESIEFQQSHHQEDKCKFHKNPAQSAIHKELGNTLFKQKKLLQSLTSYNQAIALAPFFGFSNQKLDTRIGPKDSENATRSTGDQELFPLSLANRSAVYFELGERFYEKALEDADLALKYGYPGRLRSKLLLRKANIYVKRKEWDLARTIIKQIQTEIPQSPGDDGVDKGNHLSPDIVAKIKELEDKIQISMIDETEEKVNQPGADLDTKLQFVSNEKFENASTAVEISYLDKSTRFVKANTDLKKGGVVFQEEPFASVLLPQFYESHCHHCHRMLENDHFFPYVLLKLNNVYLDRLSKK